MLAIQGAQVLPVSSPPLDAAVLLIDEGKIVACGERIVVPAECSVIDGTGKVVTPGLIDAHTHLGVYGESLDWSGEDVNETSEAVTPVMHVVDAFNPFDVGLADARAGGVTVAMVAPGSANPAGGQCMVVKTRRAATVEEMVIVRHAGLKIAFGENPRRVYGDNKKAPVTRMATAALIRQMLVKGNQYVAGVNEKEHKFDLAMEAVCRVLRREMPLRAHAHRADDIVTACRIADEFGLALVIEHATEAHLIADFLAARQTRLVLGPFLTTRVKMELKERNWEAPALLAARQVKFAIMSDHPVVPSCFLPLYAGFAARYGLSEEQALRAVTLDAAEILGIADRVGSIGEGKDADVVLWSGNPLQLSTRPEKVFIDGILQHSL